MSDAIEWLKDPDLHEPMLVAAFSGWSDASDAATGAVRWLIAQWQAERIARIPPDHYFDFTVARPSVRLEAGGQRSIVWPTIDAFSVRAPGIERDFVLLFGREPHLHWPDFAAAMAELAQRCGVTRAVTLGAFFGAVLHSAPPPLTGFANEEAIIRRLDVLGVTPSTYEGPTGIASVLHDRFRRDGLSSLSLWAAVPFYLGSVRPNPRATYGLLSGLSRVLELNIDLERLRHAADYFDEQIERQVRESKELTDLIARLRDRPVREGGTPESTERPPEPAAELPSADAIIRDLEAFLRGRQSGQGPEQPSEQG